LSSIANDRWFAPPANVAVSLRDWRLREADTQHARTAAFAEPLSIGTDRLEGAVL
jgi:hypothetical protein